MVLFGGSPPILWDFYQTLSRMAPAIQHHPSKQLRHRSRVMRKPAFYICKNKDADQLRGNREANQRLCFHYTDSTIPLLPTSETSSLYSSSVAVQTSLCQTWSKTQKTSFLTTRLIYTWTVRQNHFSWAGLGLLSGQPVLKCSFGLQLCSEEPYSPSMSQVVRKPVFGVSDQVRHKPGCTATEDG